MDWVNDGFTDNLPLWNSIVRANCLRGGRNLNSWGSLGDEYVNRRNVSNNPIANPKTTSRNGLFARSINKD